MKLYGPIQVEGGNQGHHTSRRVERRLVTRYLKVGLIQMLVSTSNPEN